MTRLSPLLLIILSASQTVAQLTTLRGQVADESGAVVPAAKVTLTGAPGPSKTTTSDTTGAYAFAALAPGNYSVVASAPGLAQAQPAKVSLKGGSQTLNLVLRVAGRLDQV